VRIVSLLPSATEILCALGLEESLVALSHECDYPESVRGLPRITSSILPGGLDPAQVDAAVVEAVRGGRALYKIDGTMLEALRPDLIVTQGVCDVCAVGVGTLQETLKFLPDCLPEGARTLTLSGTTFEGILRDIRLTAEATGTEATAAALVAGLRARWEALAARSVRHRPKVLMLEWPDPPFYGGHWVPEMVAVAGGADVFGQVGVDSARVTWGEIAEAAPEVVVVVACGYGLEENLGFARALYEHPEAKGLPAVRAGAVFAADANSYFSRPGPRVVRGAELLRAILTGEPLNAEEAVRVLPERAYTEVI